MRRRDYATHLLDIARASRGAVLGGRHGDGPSVHARRENHRHVESHDRSPRPVPPCSASRPRRCSCSSRARRPCGSPRRVRGRRALQGIVYDSSGGVLPGVEMALVNEQGDEVVHADRRRGPLRVRAGRRGQVRARSGDSRLQDASSRTSCSSARRTGRRIITMQVGELQETIQVTARRPRSRRRRRRRRYGRSGAGRAATSSRRRRSLNVPPVYPAGDAGGRSRGRREARRAHRAPTDTVASVRVAELAGAPRFRGVGGRRGASSGSSRRRCSTASRSRSDDRVDLVQPVRLRSGGGQRRAGAAPVCRTIGRPGLQTRRPSIPQREGVERIAGDDGDVLLAVDRVGRSGRSTIWPPRLAFHSTSPLRASSA